MRRHKVRNTRRNRRSFSKKAGRVHKRNFAGVMRGGYRI